jgi:2-phospho-L-lactate guanylyltransferase (CobY/MobA/RfbA family)
VFTDADEVLILPGDVPLVSVAELRALRDSAGDPHSQPRAVSAVMAMHGGGTNALWLRPPDVIRPQFGGESFDRHLAAAEAESIDVLDGPVQMGIGIDIDTREDVTLFAALSRGRMPTLTQKVLRHAGLLGSADVIGGALHP